MYQEFLKKSKTRDDKLFWQKEYLKELQDKQKRDLTAIHQQEYSIEKAKENIKRFRSDMKKRAKIILKVESVEFD
jgi:hypothetical protein